MINGFLKTISLINIKIHSSISDSMHVINGNKLLFTQTKTPPPLHDFLYEIKTSYLSKTLRTSSNVTLFTSEKEKISKLLQKFTKSQLHNFFFNP